jgi:ribosomal protein S11
MWPSTSIDRKKTKASTTLLSRVPIFKRIAAICFAASLAFPPMAQARDAVGPIPSYNATWNGVYGGAEPGRGPSSSGNNASCFLCHATDPASSSWNAYGFAIRSAMGSTLATRIRNVESLNSDGNPATNLAEINANAQPGWTTGANNSKFFSAGPPTFVAAPPGIGLLDPSTPTFTVGGTVSGLTGIVTLRNNGGDSLARNTNGSFTFATVLTTGSPYAVTVFSQPVGQTCTVANGSGIVAAGNVTNVAVTCVTNPATFTVGGTVAGLTGSVTLRNNGGDNLVRTVNGAFAFATPLATGSPYAVTVFSQPAGQTCAVINGSGNIASANATNVVVTCSVTSNTNLDLNQHGLTGSWYEAAASGQGVEVEVFPNPSGTGSTFVSWFTYDRVIGGAERQRWYTAQGQVVTGQPSATLTIFQNTGGNFNAPPATTPQPVGNATLSFDTCGSGQLSYSFTDGTGRTGSIPLTRLTQNVTCSVFSVRPTNADFALSGNWYGTATSGQGLTVEVNPVSGALFAAWYTYAPNGAGTGAAGQRWYTVQAAFTPGMRSIPVTIYETTGGVFDAPPPSGQKTLAVGTGTMAFQSCAAATFSYSFTSGSSSGRSGTITLSRVGPIPPGCTT